MIRRVLFLCGAASIAAACGNPELAIDFEIREPYRGEIEAVTLQILEPAQAAPFTCNDLAFGNADPEAVALSRVGEISASSLNTALPDIDRVSRKVFWADGISAGGRRIVTGCAELGEISSDETIRILAEPVARVIAPVGVSLSAVLGNPLANPVTLSVKDALDAPLAGVSATYSIEGAIGAGSNGETESDDDGVFTISPTLPERPGPFVLDLRVRWAEAAPVFLSGVIAPEVETLDLPARALDYRSGSIGTDRERGFAALLADGVGSVRVSMIYTNAMTSQRVLNTSERILSADTPRLGVIEYSGRGRDSVIAVSSSAWYEIFADGALAQRTAYTGAGGALPVAVFTGGACRGSDDPQVLIAFSDGIVRAYSTAGALRDQFALPSGLELSASGCVSGQNDALERTLVFGQPGGIGVLPAVAQGMEFLAASWFALPTAIAFAPPLGDGRRLMFGTQLSVNDIVVSRASLVRTADALELNIEGNDTVPNVPRATLAGDIDGDQLVDAVSLFQRSDESMALAVWAVLGREHRGRRISADVNLGSAGLRNPALLLVDIDRDGFDDVLLGEIGSAAAASRVEIYSMGPPP